MRVEDEVVRFIVSLGVVFRAKCYTKRQSPGEARDWPLPGAPVMKVAGQSRALQPKTGCPGAPAGVTQSLSLLGDCHHSHSCECLSPWNHCHMYKVCRGLAVAGWDGLGRPRLCHKPVSASTSDSQLILT